MKRVIVLMADNRRIRREMLQVQLSSASDDGTPSAVLDQQSGQVANQQHEPQQQHQQSERALHSFGSVVASMHNAAACSGLVPAAASNDHLQPATAPPAVAGDVMSRQEALSAELARARCTLASLESENERLMELSNALRSERDRLVMQLKAQVKVSSMYHPDGLRDSSHLCCIHP